MNIMATWLWRKGAHKMYCAFLLNKHPGSDMAFDILYSYSTCDFYKINACCVITLIITPHVSFTDWKLSSYKTGLEKKTENILMF